MPNGRFVSRTIALSTQLAGVSLEADYLFGRCIPHLDVDGRLTGEPALVKASVVPLRTEMTPDKIASCLAELTAARGIDNTPLVYWYQTRGHKCLEFPAFRAHQRGMHPEREAKSKLPASSDPDALPVVACTGPDLIRTNSGPARDEVRLREVKVSEVKVSEDGRGAQRARTERRDWIAPLLEPYQKRGHQPDARAIGMMRRAAKPLIDAHGMNVVVACVEGLLDGWKGDVLPGFHQVTQNFDRLKERWAVVATDLLSVHGDADPRSWAPMPPEWPDGWTRKHDTPEPATA